MKKRTQEYNLSKWDNILCNKERKKIIKKNGLPSMFIEKKNMERKTTITTNLTISHIFSPLTCNK
jgi:hypothetical protein